MRNKKNKSFQNSIRIRQATGILVLSMVFVSSCEEFLEVAPPRTDLVRSTVFTEDGTATAAVTDIYSSLSSSGFASGDILSVTFLASLSSDQAVNYNIAFPDFQQFNGNALEATNAIVASVWRDLYSVIYRCNVIIEGLTTSTQLSEGVAKNLMGEVKFMRGFCFFYLVNLFGDVPLALTSDYRLNRIIARTAASEVYGQIVKDLNEAKVLLANDYSFSMNERVRVNASAASALLARTYLFQGDWENAVVEATVVIDNPTYAMANGLNDVFLRNSSETIWQLFTVSNFPNDMLTFINFAAPRNAALRESFVESFDPSDLRLSNWIGATYAGIDTFYYASKYKLVPQSQYSSVLRLAELYLIRSESRAHLGDLSGSQSDINIIRGRVGLDNTTAADIATLLSAIEEERNHELFTEWGHRWLDLKRTRRTTDILEAIKPGWSINDELYPIPEEQIINDDQISQNPGY